MSDPITAALIGAVVALVTNLMAKPVFDLLSRRSEERRWYFNYLIPQRLEALNNLYAASIELRFFLDRWSVTLDMPIASREKRQAVFIRMLDDESTKQHDPFDTAVAHASIHLDDAARQAVEHLQEEAFLALTQIEYAHNPPDKWPDGLAQNIDQTALAKAFDVAHVELRRILSPRELHRLSTRGKGAA